MVSTPAADRPVWPTPRGDAPETSPRPQDPNGAFQPPDIGAGTPALAAAAPLEAATDALTAANMEHLLEQQEVEAAETDGLTLLQNVFDSMATDGKITMDQLPFVLVGAELQATPEDIERAIEEHVPDSDDAEALLDFHQVQCLYSQLAHRSADMALLNAPQVEGRKPAIWTRLWRRLQAYKQMHQNDGQRTAYERHMKPTTRLLVMILACASALCIAAVVFSVAIIWIHSSNTMMAHMERTAQLVKDGMYLFGYEHPFENYNSTLERQAMLVGVMVDHLGYQDTMSGLTASMVYEQKLLIDFLDTWFAEDSMNTVGTNAMLGKGWLENLYNRRGEASMVAMIDRINPLLPAGHEMLLGRWNASNQTIALLCTPRYANQCLNGRCIIANEAIILAATGGTGTLFTTDYRPHRVVAGYTYMNVSDTGLVYKVDVEMFQADFLDPMRTIIDEINVQSAETVRTGTNSLDRQNSQEVVLAVQVDGQMEVASTLRGCDSKCLQTANVQGSLINLAFQGVVGVNETIDFNGEPVVMAYGPFQYAGFALAIKTTIEEFDDGLYVGIANALDAVNAGLPGTKEVQFATINTTQLNSSTAATQTMNFQTQFKFPDQCQAECGSTPGSSAFLRRALVGCEAGVMTGPDYRNASVVAGYACVQSIKGGVSMKVDVAQVIAEGTAMVGTIAEYENNVRYKGLSTEVQVAKMKPGITEVRTAADEDRITVQRFADQCPNETCTGSDTLMRLALEGLTGTIRGPDYRNRETLGAYTYIPGLEVGVVVKMDSDDADRNTVEIVLQLVGCAIAAVLVSMLLLAVLSNILLKTMDRTWDEGKRAIEQEKEQLCNVITAMYPPQVARRMLAGETQIVHNVGSATVFFSDIYEFTAASNTITPEQLIQFLGYTFGTMDAIADYHHVHKVKTIGDAYLAVAGLPGSEARNGHSILDMMLFATCCAQLFGQRFLHPYEGAIMDTVARNLFTKKKQVKMATGPEATYAPISGAAPLAPGPEGAVPEVHCTMRYGVSVGPITAGVLQGKTPLFDIWGRTVNLASRMESTGQPGRIQVAEGVYQTVTVLKGQPFTFEARHKVFCKGFGNVSAYFVNTCSVAPPKELLHRLHVEPNYGQFYFDNPVPGFRRAVARSGTGAGSHHDSSHRSSHSNASVHSSEAASPPIRATAALRS